MKWGFSLSKKRLGLASVLIIIFLIISAVLGGFLVNDEILSGGFQPTWTFSSLDPIHHHYSNSYWIMLADNNGTVYLLEELAARNETISPRNFVAVSENGSLLWRRDVFTYPWLRMGGDGNLYYSDAANLTDWEANGFSSASNYLYSLSPDGQLRWQYHAPKGYIQFCCAFSDGTVIARHGYSQVNRTTNLITEYVDELVCLSPAGEPRWSGRSMSDANRTFYVYDPQVLDNDTMLMFGGSPNNSYEVGMNKNGNELWNFTTLYRFNSYAGGPVFYGVSTTYVNSTMAIIRMDALDSRNGSFAWRTVIRKMDNPENYPAGTVHGDTAYVDGKGNVYGLDVSSRNIYAFDTNGKLLWTEGSIASVIRTYSSGGILVTTTDANYPVTRINPDGNALWRSEAFNTGEFRILVTSNDMVYTATPFSVVLFEISSFSNNMIWLSVLVICDIIVIAIAFFSLGRRATIK